jgi:hypothetical protein
VGDDLHVGGQNVHVGQGPANGSQRLPQAGAGAGLAHVAPEQRGDLVTSEAPGAEHRGEPHSAQRGCGCDDAKYAPYGIR